MVLPGAEFEEVAPGLQERLQVRTVALDILVQPRLVVYLDRDPVRLRTISIQFKLVQFLFVLPI